MALPRALTCFFHDVELIYVGDKLQRFFKYMNILKFHDKPQITVNDRSHQFVLDISFNIKGPTTLKEVNNFCPNLA